jgi:hypothetical protein
VDDERIPVRVEQVRDPVPIRDEGQGSCSIGIDQENRLVASVGRMCLSRWVPMTPRSRERWRATSGITDQSDRCVVTDSRGCLWLSDFVAAEVFSEADKKAKGRCSRPLSGSRLRQPAPRIALIRSHFPILERPGTPFFLATS